MQRATLLFSFLLLISCTAVRQLANEKVENKYDCLDINLRDKFPLVEVSLDKNSVPFLFDTGAMRSTLIDSLSLPSFKNKKASSLGVIMGADGKKIKNRLYVVSFKSKIFESDEKVLSFLNMPKSSCTESNKSYSGILGLDAFFNNQSAMVLDFSLGKVCTIPSDNLPSILKTNQYLLVKSRCKYNQVFVYLTIEGKEYQFKLDTGYTGSIILPNSKKSTFKNPNKIILQGTLYKTISTIPFGEDILYEKMPVSFAGIDLESKATVSESIKAQNLGIDFIKGFDWIIDYNHNKVYVKRNQNKIESNFSRKGTYYVRVVQEKLVIIIKEKSQTKYQLGDQILSVNDQKVSVSNACELEEFLNKTEDWGAIKLEVLSTSKQ